MAFDAAGFRAEFPVFESVSFLNAGSAVRARIDSELRGRGGHASFQEVLGLADRVRPAYAAVLGADPSDVALTGSTTDGCNTVIAGLELGPGDEIVTSDEEHPGLLAPLAQARRRRGVSITVAPFAEVHAAVGPATKLIACSHVSWVGGKVSDVAALVGTGVPVLLDGAQALGAIPVDVRALGVDYYAAPGQKWLCGPEGSGSLYVRRERLDELAVPWSGFGSLADPHDPLDCGPAEGAKRFDHGFPAGIRSAFALASLEMLASYGWDAVFERAATLATRLADDLAGHGLAVAPRGRSTLVSWEASDAEAEVARLAAGGFVTRFIPATFRYVRASVGAWCSEDELARLVELAAGQG